MTRRRELDALRGLMLVLMTLTHLPTRWASPVGQPLGYVSAAEGFVLLSACLCGLVYTRQARSSGIASMRRAFWRRALVIYGCQVAALLFLFTVIALIGVSVDQPAVKNLMSFYLQHPLTGLLSGLALLYQPPLLDILPMYVLFMLASPWVLAHGMRRGWHGVLAVSLGLWLAAQFGATRAVYGLTVALTGLPVPLQEMGSFDTLAWQLVWVMGLWLGNTAAVQPQQMWRPGAWPRWLVACSVVVALGGFAWRHAVGQVPFPDDAAYALLLDKWLLGPLRLLGLLAWIVLALRFGPALARRLPRLGPLEALGRASLTVFSAQLGIVLVVLALFGEPGTQRPLWVDAAIVVASFAALLAVAHAWNGRKAARTLLARGGTAVPPPLPMQSASHPQGQLVVVRDGHAAVNALPVRRQAGSRR